MGIETPAEYGGSEASFTTAIIAIEELAKVDPSISVTADVHVYPSNPTNAEYINKHNNSKLWLSRTQREIFTNISYRKTRLILSF